MKTVYLALGSNSGERLWQMREAVRLLTVRGAIEPLTASSVYRNRAVGMGEAPDFYNAVVCARSALRPGALLRACLEVERELGRVRSGCWGPRTIDIDLLLHGDLELETDDLILPHPRIAERDFVVVPLCEIDPHLRVGASTVAELRARLEEEALVRVEAPLLVNGPSVSIIVACSENRVIGRDGGLPWSIPEDWANFLRKTYGGVLVLGRRCFEEMRKEPCWLDGRTYAVITSHPEAIARGAAIRAFPDLASALARLRQEVRPIWICGGEAIYNESLPLADRLYLTLVRAEVEGDTFFPPWREHFPLVVDRSDGADANYRYTFYALERGEGDYEE